MHQKSFFKQIVKFVFVVLIMIQIKCFIVICVILVFILHVMDYINYHRINSIFVIAVGALKKKKVKRKYQ